jgi:hypothetical protein
MRCDINKPQYWVQIGPTPLYIGVPVTVFKGAGYRVGAGLTGRHACALVAGEGHAAVAAAEKKLAAATHAALCCIRPKYFLDMAVTGVAELEGLLERARADGKEERTFFRCLLGAWVYAHAPLSDDHSRVRLIQFRHPDGFYAVPFFSSEAKAQRAGQGGVRIVKLTGRELLAGAPGATFMLNPNDGGCVLYPEEVDALLKTGAVARVEQFHLDDENPFLVSEQADPPAWLMPSLTALYTQLSFVEAAYLLEVAPSQAPTERSLLIALAVAAEYAERAVRATITAIQPLCARSHLALDITAFDPTKGKPAYLSHPGVERFYGPPLN